MTKCPLFSFTHGWIYVLKLFEWEFTQVSDWELWDDDDDHDDDVDDDDDNDDVHLPKED